MKFKISLINLLMVLGYVIIGFVVLSTGEAEIINGFNTMYLGLGLGLLITILTYFTAHDGLSTFVNVISNLIILVVALVLALVDFNWLYCLAILAGIAVIYAIALVSISMRGKE